MLVARSDATLQALENEITDTGGDVIHIVADVANRERMLFVAQEAVSRFGHFNTWINNAGVSIYGRLDEVSEADSRRAPLPGSGSDPESRYGGWP